MVPTYHGAYTPPWVYTTLYIPGYTLHTPAPGVAPAVADSVSRCGTMMPWALTWD